MVDWNRLISLLLEDEFNVTSKDVYAFDVSDSLKTNQISTNQFVIVGSKFSNKFNGTFNSDGTSLDFKELSDRQRAFLDGEEDEENENEVYSRSFPSGEYTLNVVKSGDFIDFDIHPNSYHNMMSGRPIIRLTDKKDLVVHYRRKKPVRGKPMNWSVMWSTKNRFLKAMQYMAKAISKPMSEKLKSKYFYEATADVLKQNIVYDNGQERVSVSFWLFYQETLRDADPHDGDTLLSLDLEIEIDGGTDHYSFSMLPREIDPFLVFLGLAPTNKPKEKSVIVGKTKSTVPTELLDIAMTSNIKSAKDYLASQKTEYPLK